ncbi:hypothetical protein SAMN06296058_1136 [Pseudoxanthomonas indica]|uniref:Uncharacterized protein n=2 Tax=Pseudoxanthomonas indica TaxID=428993 RepID=A0A1T5JWP4_9GAMM|nr:hypothetical protein GCM10007235_15960 [Pseudoxanthomonas indica]SKC55679.1 hypothetical protein SAMN06296058_1136 [Pseudoxanthomonas indica]
MTPASSGDAAVTVAATPLPAPAPPACCQLPDGTLIELETLEPITSARARRGDHFRLRSTAAITVGDVVVLPAGIEGVGEVIHADKARSGGKAGELLLAARFLQLDGRTLPLRGMQLGRSGKDQSNTSAAVSAAVGVFGLLVQGGEIVIPAGTLAHAKLKGALDLAPLSAPAATPAADPTASPDNAVSTQPQKE